MADASMTREQRLAALQKRRWALHNAAQEQERKERELRQQQQAAMPPNRRVLVDGLRDVRLPEMKVNAKVPPIWTTDEDLTIPLMVQRIRDGVNKNHFIPADREHIREIRKQHRRALLCELRKPKPKHVQKREEAYRRRREVEQAKATQKEWDRKLELHKQNHTRLPPCWVCKAVTYVGGPAAGASNPGKCSHRFCDDCVVSVFRHDITCPGCFPEARRKPTHKNRLRRLGEVSPRAQRKAELQRVRVLVEDDEPRKVVLSSGEKLRFPHTTCGVFHATGLPRPRMFYPRDTYPHCIRCVVCGLGSSADIERRLDHRLVLARAQLARERLTPTTLETKLHAIHFGNTLDMVGVPAKEDVAFCPPTKLFRSGEVLDDLFICGGNPHNQRTGGCGRAFHASCMCEHITEDELMEDACTWYCRACRRAQALADDGFIAPDEDNPTMAAKRAWDRPAAAKRRRLSIQAPKVPILTKDDVVRAWKREREAQARRDRELERDANQIALSQGPAMEAHSEHGHVVVGGRRGINSI